MTEHVPDCDDYAFSGAGFHPTCERSCICRQVARVEHRVKDEERARIVAGINAWCIDDPVISRADPNDVWHYAAGVRFTRQRIERGDFNE
jgi:hypothetical protein